MSTRNPGRARQVRKDRSFGKELSRDTSSESTSSCRNESNRLRKCRDSKQEELYKNKEKHYDSSTKLPSNDSKAKVDNSRRIERTHRDKSSQLTRDTTGRDRRVGNDDSRLWSIIRQIRENDSEKRLSAAKNFEDFVNQPANTQDVIKVLDDIVLLTESVFRERNVKVLKEQLAKCIGIICSQLGSEMKGFVFMIISKVENASSDEIKSLFVKILNKAVELDEKKHHFQSFIPLLLDKLQSILENVDTSDLLHSVLSIIMPIAVEYPNEFTPHFRDTVDILIGWHIDTSQHDTLIQFTSDCLVSMHRYWVADINFSLTLLTQFLEDMEAYSEELKCLADGQIKETDVSPPYSSLPKLTALVRVFTTVMNGIGECFTPLRTTAITQSYIEKLSNGVVNCVRSAGYSFFYEDLFKTANDCFGIMCCFLKAQFSPCCDITVNFALEQLERKTLTFVHTKSVLIFIKQVIKNVNIALPLSSLCLILKNNSPIMNLRFSSNEDVLKKILDIFHGLLTIKKIMFVQEVYSVVVQDIQEAYNYLRTSNYIDDSVSSDDKSLNNNNCCSDENEERNLHLLHQAQLRILFGLQTLSVLNNTQYSSIQLTPSLLQLFTKELIATDYFIATRYSHMQYSIMCCFYDYSKTNNYFLSNKDGQILQNIQETLMKIIQYAFSSSDIRHLCLNWIIELINLTGTDRQNILPGINFDSLVGYILPLSFLPEEDLRLSVSLCIKLLVERQLISKEIIKKCFQECLFHVSDVNLSIKNTFVQLLSCVSVDLATSFHWDGHSRNVTSPGGTNMNCAENALTLNINGSWLTRKVHMMKPSLGTFHSHNFRLITAFILHGTLPTPDNHHDWLKRLYDTCQRNGQKSQLDPMNDKYYFSSSRHDSNSLVSISNNYTLLWFWATWELSQFCVLSRLKTPLGRAQETFQVIESVLREFLAQLLLDNEQKPIRIKKKSISEESTPQNSDVLNPSLSQLRVKLLLQFVENLDKLMYSAYEGAAVSLPTFPKAVRLFFRTNKSTCQEWLFRIRGIITSISTYCGEPSMAVRHGLQLLQEMRSTGKNKDKDFEITLLVVSKAMCQLRSYESLQGLTSWCKKHDDNEFPWLRGLLAKSKGRYENAICEYEKCLKYYEGRCSETVILEFLINEVADCYSKLTSWHEILEWQRNVQEMRSSFPDDLQHVTSSLKVDMNYVRALSKFSEQDFVGVRDCLEQIPGASLKCIIDRISGSPLTMSAAAAASDCKDENTVTRLSLSINPTWDPVQILQASDINMLQAVTLYWTSGFIGSGTQKDDALRNEIRNLLDNATGLLQGVIVNSSTSWPPMLPEMHAVQYYGVQLMTKILSGKHEQNISHCMSFSNEYYSLDTAVMCKILQIISYTYYHHKLHGKYEEETEEQLLRLQLACVHVARKEDNFRLAYKLLSHHLNISSTEKSQTSVSLPHGDYSEYSDILCRDLCNKLTSFEQCELQSNETRVKISCESAKLLRSLGYNARASNILCASVLRHRNDNKCKHLNAKTLCTLHKWFQNDKKLYKEDTTCSELRSNLVKLLHDNSSIKNINLEDVDDISGELLKLSTSYAPELQKTWVTYADWAYKIGRKMVEQTSSDGCVELSKDESEKIIGNLPEDLRSSKKDDIISILCQGHFVATQDEDINSENEVLTNGEETIRKQLKTSCESLTSECIESLIIVWRMIGERLFSYYAIAVQAYFRYLKLCGDQTSVKSDVDSNSNITATLRLLRLLVKHAAELRACLEQGFRETPTTPWKGIIPQLFSRLNHPEECVRDSVTELLCRVSKDSPYLIIYTAIVGCAGNILRKEEDTDSLMKLVASRYATSDESNGVGGARDEMTLELGEDNNLQSGYHIIVESLANDNARLVSEVEEFVEELRRVTLLWEELWLGSLIQIHHDFEKRASQLNDEIKRVNASSSLTNQEKSSLIHGKHVALMRPIVFALEQLQTITMKEAETPHEKWFQNTYNEMIENALNSLKKPETPSKPERSWEKFKQLLQILQQRSQKRSSVNLRLEDISPKLCHLNPSFIYMPGQEFITDDKVVTVNSLENGVSILPTKTRPKKIVLTGSDGKRYTYLFKGLEDLHLDERIMQFLTICNNMFAKPNRYEENIFLARHYSVTPLGPRSGLIQWVDGAVPLFSLYKRWQQRELVATAAAAAAATANSNKTETSGSTSSTRAPLRPSDLFYNKLTPLLKEKGFDISNRKVWPLSIMTKVLQDLLQETPSDLLERELWCSSISTSNWWKMNQTYCRSVAVMSMIGYIIGLGDRHLDNILIDFTTGEVVHIDYNICFEKGKGLRVPERVPFRLTANLETALGVTGVEGTFRSSCEKVLRVLREGRETLLTLLEAFVYDPLVDWTTAGNENAFANAFYGGRATLIDRQDFKQNKKDMERVITQCLFSSRVAEMRVSWNANRDDMMSSLSNVEESINTYYSTINQSEDIDVNDKELLEQMEVLQTALKTPSHPLHALQAKYDEQSKIVNEHNIILQNIQERLKECKTWEIQHQTSLEAVRGTKLPNIASEVVKPLDVGLPSFAPTIGFLQNAGQSNIVSQCEQVETELTGHLHKRRVLLRACLDVLHTYATVISQFPASYSLKSSNHDWQCWLQKIIEQPSSTQCREVLGEYETKRATAINVNDETAILINIETTLQNNFNDQKTKFAKFYERRNQEKVETTFLNKTATESLQKLKQFVENEDGKLSTIHVMVTALASLHRRCVVMENTAKVAESRLVELQSRDGDWFLEELCSMTGNVIQFVTFAKQHWMDSISSQSQLLQFSMTSVQALIAIYSMYKSLQDMIFNFRNIIVPETLKCLEINDPTVSVTIKKFEDILKCYDVDHMMETMRSHNDNQESSEVLQEVRRKANDIEKEILELLNNGYSDTETLNAGEESGVQMTAGQMLLAGFNGLFTKLETELDTLLTTMENVDHSIDSSLTTVYEEIRSLQIYKLGNANVRKTLYLLKRIKVIQLFFSDCSHHASNFNNTAAVAERQVDDVLSEEQLSLHVRQFIADFVQERLLGLPSFVLTKTILQWLLLIGLDVATDIPTTNVSLDDLCKKVVEKSIKQGLFTRSVLSEANTLTGTFNTAWRKHDLARRLDLNLNLYRCVVQRAQLSLARFQWYHEDILAAAVVRGNNPISPSRSSIMSDLRKRVQSLISLDLTMAGVQEKFTQLEQSIEQRLKWAAGANPSLNPILENFERTLKDRKTLILVESKYSNEICRICNAILHFEAFRTKTTEALNADQTLAKLIQRCEISATKVEKCKENLGSVQDLVLKIRVSNPPKEPITSDWMKSRLATVKDDIVKNKTKKEQVKKLISNSKEHLRAQSTFIKTAWTAHQVLMGEVKSMLQSLAKDEGAPESNDARAFIITHNKLNEVTTKLLKDILNVSAATNDCARDQCDIMTSLNSVQTIATWIFDHLPTLASPLVKNEMKNEDTETEPLSFASALRQSAVVKTDPSVTVTSSSVPNQSSSPVNILSPIRQPTSSNSNPVTKKQSLRDPRTGKALQERNFYAIGVWKKVKAKLDGRDVDSTKRMSVEDQVEHIVKEATSKEHLCLMYEGWTPWV